MIISLATNVSKLPYMERKSTSGYKYYSARNILPVLHPGNMEKGFLKGSGHRQVGVMVETIFRL